MRQSCLQYAQPAASHPFWPGWTLVTTQVRGICAHPLCQQSDILSALPTTPIRIERIRAVRSGAANEWKRGVLAAGSGCDFRCGNAHIPVVCNPAVFLLSAISLIQHSSDRRPGLEASINDTKNKAVF